MATSRVKTSSILQGFPKSRSLLAGNPYYAPTAYESIATVTVGSGGAADISFTSIPSTFTHLQIRGIARSASGGASALFYKINNDTSVSNYSTHLLDGNGSSASAYGAADDWPQGTLSGFSNSFAVYVIDILDYTNTNKYKTIRSLSGFDNNGSGTVRFSSGATYINTNAITQIDLVPGSSTLQQYSSFALYGIKGA